MRNHHGQYCFACENLVSTNRALATAETLYMSAGFQLASLIYTGYRSAAGPVPFGPIPRDASAAKIGRHLGRILLSLSLSPFYQRSQPLPISSSCFWLSAAPTMDVSSLPPALLQEIVQKAELRAYVLLSQIFLCACVWNIPLHTPCVPSGKS